MTMFKRVLSLALTLLLVIGLMAVSGTALADVHTISLSVQSIGGGWISLNSTNLRAGATANYDYGTEFTLTANERDGRYEFLYWTNNNGVILSTDSTYTFTLLSKTVINAVFAEAAEDYFFVSFVDKNQTVVQSEWAEAGASVTPPAQSALGSYYGLIFDGWDSDAYRNVNGNLIINATYTVDPSIRYTVTTNNAAAVLAPSAEGTYEYALRETATVTVDTSKLADGTYFMGWSLDGQTVVSYLSTYSFVVFGDTEIYLMTTDDPNFVRPAVVTLTGSEYEQNGAIRINLTAVREVPEEYTVVEAGILIARSAAYRNMLTLENVDNSNIRKATTPNLTNNGTCSSNAGTSQDIYAVGYVSYRTAGGDLEVVYSDLYAWPPLPEPHTVTFFDWDGTVLSSQQVDDGASATAPASPSRTGYTFAGWDTTFAVVTSDLTVTATYSLSTYTIRYYVNNQLYTTQQVAYGAPIVPPEDPVRTGEVFNGWRNVPATMPAKDLTIHGYFLEKDSSDNSGWTSGWI